MKPYAIDRVSVVIPVYNEEASLPELLRVRKQLGDRLLTERPDLFIGVDAPDFNFDLEARLKKGAPSAAAPHKTAKAAKPKVPEPPFNVVGLELRGGERFVSIASHGAVTLTDLRLLREGESIGAWQLQAIDAHAVVFRVDDQTVRVALP